MSYVVHVPDPIRQKIDSWNADVDFKIRVYEEIESILETLPEADLKRVVAPVRSATHKIKISWGGSVHGIFLWIDDWTKPGVRTVVSAKWLSAKT